MFRRFFSKYPIFYCAHIPGLTNTNVYDQPNDVPKLEPKNGIERVFALYQPDERGEMKKEVISAIQMTMGSGIMLAFYGGYKESKHAFENWLTLNSTTRFKTSYQAKRALHDHIALKFGKHFLIYGFKGMLFTGVLWFTLITVAAFRDKNGILEYTVAGAVAGSLMKFHLGLRGIFSGAFLGIGFCTIAGVFMTVLMKITNISIDDIRKWQYDLSMMRKGWRREMEYKADKDKLSMSFKLYTSRLTQPRQDDDDDDDEDKVFVLVNEEKKIVTNDDTPKNTSAEVVKS